MQRAPSAKPPRDSSVHPYAGNTPPQRQKRRSKKKKGEGEKKSSGAHASRSVRGGRVGISRSRIQRRARRLNTNRPGFLARGRGARPAAIITINGDAAGPEETFPGSPSFCPRGGAIVICDFRIRCMIHIHTCSVVTSWRGWACRTLRVRALRYTIYRGGW